MEVIHIYHTNDLHSHFENWPRIYELLRERKKWHNEAGEAVYLFDIGDHLDLSHPYTEATKGRINTKLLNKERYDAVTIGNNEGITLPYEALDHLYDDALFDVIVANLYKNNGERPDWAIPHQIYKTAKGTKIGVIGITAYFAQLYELLGWKLTEPIQELSKQIEELRGQVDIIILLSHLGINDDEMIATNYPEIDVILGAHTHHIFHQGKIINNNLQGAAGKYGYYVGHIELKVDDLKKVIDKKAILYETSKLPIANEEEAIIENYYLQGKQALSEKAVTIGEYLSQEVLAKILCEKLVSWCHSDCAILNEGLILNGLEEGDVTFFDLLSICPHPINPCNVTLTGAELKEILLDMKVAKWETLQVKGLGFRGTLMGKMISAGITQEKSGDIDIYYIQSEEIQPNQNYVVTVPDMLTFGNFFPSIYRATKKDYFLPEFMRNILADTLQNRIKA
ncbi:bifunctional UDP-sugar hydrolase/5'-nucleotidase [Niallia sp.]|uniref:bifunctional metallophosphatase/5'-nucleotidase n=1 Tax=Niallia sp. TaxID=2837523 RepID=UPI00289DCC26|nr:bifunctional UDP-sugar hydrolase/5'-nucleotidase [Niallia sp.]